MERVIRLHQLSDLLILYILVSAPLTTSYWSKVDLNTNLKAVKFSGNHNMGSWKGCFDFKKKMRDHKKKIIHRPCDVEPAQLIACTNKALLVSQANYLFIKLVSATWTGS